ncbi:unnamed protein product [Linum trigynum]|uniref:Uncharacterized protein n=1 Tax=Linum trigynum TaxID=586398 RepID=A0AAV2EPA5_9ROSI
METGGINAKLNSKNFALWVQFRMFVEGQGFAGHLDESTKKPTVPPTSNQELAKCVQSDAELRSWILKSVDPSIVLGFHLLPIATVIWKLLCDTYDTTSVTRQFELEIELGNLHQGNQDVTTYFNSARLLWTEQDLLGAALSSQQSAELQA